MLLWKLWFSVAVLVYKRVGGWKHQKKCRLEGISKNGILVENRPSKLADHRERTWKNQESGVSRWHKQHRKHKQHLSAFGQVWSEPWPGVNSECCDRTGEHHLTSWKIWDSEIQNYLSSFIISHHLYHIEPHFSGFSLWPSGFPLDPYAVDDGSAPGPWFAFRGDLPSPGAEFGGGWGHLCGWSFLDPQNGNFYMKYS